jgi:ankyrin repeat protein
MHLAARSNNLNAVKALLAAGVSPLTPKTRGNPPHVRGCVIRIVGAPGHSTIGDTPLMYACHAGHLETVIEFVPKLTNVEDLYRALHWAAERGRASIVDLILKQPGVDVNAKLQGDTALFAACKSGDLKTIEILIKAGADPNVFCANATGDRQGSSDLSPTSGQRKETPDSKAKRGYTALHALCENPGRWDRQSSQPAECVMALLKAGADVQAMTPSGSTALHYAFGFSIKLLHAFGPSIEFIKPLLDTGADPAAENDAGETALHSTKPFGDEVLSLLLESGKLNINKPRAEDGTTPLLCRIGDRIRDDRNIIEFLAYKPDVNATDFKGNGPLHLALKQSRPSRELIDALLAAGADPNLRNEAGNTPLHEMANDIDQELIRSLLSAGADLEVRNNRGHSVLFAQLSSARGSGDGSKILDHFAGQGACLDARDYRGRALWHCAINNLDTITRLWFLDLDPLVSDYGGNIPLHELVTNKALSNKREILERLLDIGMNINQRNYQGRTVLHAVCSRYDYEEPKFGESIYTLLDYVLGQCECLTVSVNV